MIEIYSNRKSIRLKNYDYSQNGMYYVTICTKNRENLLSNITAVGADTTFRPSEKINNNIEKIYKYENIVYSLNLTKIGKIVYDMWYKIPTIYNSVKLHKFIIMPNHIHGIIEIQNYFNRKYR